jgi:uncharacterized membrane protein
MKKFFVKLKELHLAYDTIIAALGILLVIFLGLTFAYPKNRIFLYTAFTAGGLINIMNGLKIVNDKKKRTMGISYIFFGIIIILLGIFSGSLMNR